MKKKLQDRIEEADKQLNAHLQAIQEAIDNIFASAKNSKSLQDLMEAEKRLESITSFAPQESVLSDAAKMTESIHRVQTVVSELPNQIDQLTNYRCPIQIGFTSVIKAECQRKLNEFLKKQADWVKQYISPVEYEVRTMNAPRCSAWLSQTQTLPNYLDHQTVKRYHEVRRSVEQRLHSCRVQGVVSMFNELSNEEKEECLKILQKTN